jgi:aspartyl protease family protein
MIKGVVALAIGVVALAAMAPAFAPRGLPAPEAPEPPGASDAPAGAEAQAGAAKRQTAGYREAAIAADARGQFAADALIDGMPVHMMIDTGASIVAISASTAARLGLTPGPGPKWTIKTANGESLASPVTLESVSFGGLYMWDVQALVLAPEAGDVNLLGASFLKRLASVDERDGIMVLRQ